MKFTKTIAGHYNGENGFDIERTYCWVVRHRGCYIMGYRTLAAAKAGAAEFDATWPKDIDEASTAAAAAAYIP